MARGTRRSDMRRLTPRRLSWFGWFMGRLAFAGKIALGVAVVAGLMAWVLAEGYMVDAAKWAQQQVVDATASMGLRVADVRVEGRHYVDADALKAAIGVEPGDALMGIDIDAVHDRLVAMSWVREAAVRRALPDQLIIVLEERLPIAIWRDAPGGPALIDMDGVSLTHRDLESYGKLLLVEGKNANKEMAALLALLKGQPDIAVRVQKAVRVSDRRWDLAMDGGSILRLPEDDPGFALARAAKAQEQEKILDQGLKAIDLRQSDRIILESKPGDARDLLLKGGDPV